MLTSEHPPAIMSRQDLDIAAFARERDYCHHGRNYAELTYDAPHTSIVSLPACANRTIFCTALEGYGP